MERTNLQQPQMLEQSRIQPGRWWYAFAVLILLAGFACFLAYVVSLFTGDRFTLQRVVVPGTHQLEFPETGKRVIFHEHQSVIDGVVFSTGNAAISGLECILRPADATGEIPVSPVFGNVTYNAGRHSGKAILKFRISQPGTYTLTAEYSDASQAPQIVLAIGANPVRKIVLAIAVCILLLVGPFLVSAVIFGITLYRRWQANKALAHL